MDNNYIKFIIAYDFGYVFDQMELACDEAYELAEEIAKRYVKYAEENKIEQCYESLYEYCKSISFNMLWNGIKMTEDKQKIYDEMCKVLTDWETQEAVDDDLYNMLVKIQNNWECIITAEY